MNLLEFTNNYLYSETERGIITAFYRDLDVLEEEFLLEIDNTIYEKVFLQFSDTFAF